MRHESIAEADRRIDSRAHAAMYDEMATQRAICNRLYVRPDYLIENAVTALHYALMAEHERLLEAVEGIALEQAA